MNGHTGVKRLHTSLSVDDVFFPKKKRISTHPEKRLYREENSETLRDVDILLDELADRFGVAVELLAEALVVESLQLLDPAVDHACREDAVLLEERTPGGEDVGRLTAGRRELPEGGETILELRPEDVADDIEVFGLLEGVGHVKAVERGDEQGGDGEIGIAGTVGDAVLDRLLRRPLNGAFISAGVGVAGHVRGTDPAQGHADHDRAVAVAPADVSRGLLVGDQTEVRGRDAVAESRDSVRCVEDTGDHLPGHRAELAVLDHQVLAVLLDEHVEVHAAPRLADGDLRGITDVDAVAVAEHAEDPLRQDDLLDSLLDRHREELDLVLLVVGVLVAEAADLGVAVLDLAAGAGDQLHRLVPQALELRKGLGRVVALLVAAGVEVLARADHVVFEFAEGLEDAAGLTGELLVRLAEHVFGGALQGLALVVIEGAEEFESRHLGEGVHEGGAVAGDRIQVAAPGLDEGEEVAAVDTLAVGEDGVEVLLRGDDEVEGLELAVLRGVPEVHHLDRVFFAEVDDVFLGKFRRVLLEKTDQIIGIHENLRVFHNFPMLVLTG